MPKINKISVIYTKKSNKKKKTKKNKLKSHIKIKNGGNPFATLGRRAATATVRGAQQGATASKHFAKKAVAELSKEGVSNAAKFTLGRQSLSATLRHALSQGSQATHARKSVRGLF
jgi:hypothetical protein